MKDFWCIVTYVAHTPLYYCGYYDRYNHENEDSLRPAISVDFNKALKCHSKEEAERILNGINRVKLHPDWKVEGHGYF